MDFLDLQSDEKDGLASVTSAFILAQHDFHDLVKSIYMRVITAFAAWPGNYRFVTTTNAHIQKLLEPVARAVKDSVLQAVNRTHTDGSKKHAAAVEAVNAVLGKVRKKANKCYVQVSGDMAHDGKFAIPLDEASGIGAFINGARTHSEATVCSEWIEIPFVRTDGSLGKEWVMIMKTKRLLFRQEALLYKYSDCFETPTQALLRHADLRAAARTMLPHLDVCVC